MPPAISDNEESDVEAGVELEVPLRDGRKEGSADKIETDVGAEPPLGQNGDAAEDDEEDDEGDDEGDDGADVFIVEKILAHKVDANDDITFQVKWEGYDAKADLTWEPEENLFEGAEDLLKEYYNKHGGRDQIIEESGKARSTKKRGRAASGQTGGTKRSRKNGDHPANGTPPLSATANDWKPPSGSWEDEIESIDACEDETSGGLIIFLNWKNGRKTKHGTEVVYRRCPQKMLRFYERHVRVIKQSTSPQEANAIKAEDKELENGTKA